jgi:hypothetical protein
MKTQEAYLWQRPDYTYKITGQWSLYGIVSFNDEIEINASFTSNETNFSKLSFVLNNDDPGIYYDDV